MSKLLIGVLLASLAACGDNEHAEPLPACEPVTFTAPAGGEVCPDERHAMTVEVRGDMATIVCACPVALESDRGAPWSHGVVEDPVDAGAEADR